MHIDKKGNTTIITQKNLSIVELVNEINTNYSKFANDNIIVNLFSIDKLVINDVVEFLQLSNSHREAKHSFVIVAPSFDLEESLEELIIVPTLQEAHDIIEMEEMERDLGF